MIPKQSWQDRVDGRLQSEILLLADADNKVPPLAQMLMARAAARFLALGLTVRVARPKEGHDFNSMLMGKAGREMPARAYVVDLSGGGSAAMGGVS